MARLQIKKITSGRGLSIVQTNSSARIANYSTHANSDGLDVYNFATVSDNKEYNNFFNISEFDLQSSINLNAPHQSPEYLKEIMPDGSSDFIQVAQINDFVLGLTSPTPQGIRAEFTDTDVLDIDNTELQTGLCGFVTFEESIYYPDDLTGYIQHEYERHLGPSGSVGQGICATIFSNRNFINNREYQEMPPYICIYPSSGEIYSTYQLATGTDGLTTTGEVALNDIFYPKVLLSGIAFNYVSEIPVNEYPSYDHYILSGASGFTYGDPRVFSNSLNLKNMYDYKWDVNANVSASLSSFIDNNIGIDFSAINKSIGEVLSAELKFARNYYKINVSNFNTVWLTYKNNLYYSGNETLSSETTRSIPNPENITDLSGVVYYEDGGLTISDNMSIVYPVTSGSNIDVDTSPINNYEFVERIKGWNRFSYQPHHKSNFYSLMLENTGLNDNLNNLEDTTVKTKLQNSINNIIRKMVDKILPIHTQLLNIYWTGD